MVSAGGNMGRSKERGVPNMGKSSEGPIWAVGVLIMGRSIFFLYMVGAPQSKFHFLLRLGVRGKPLNSYKFWGFDSAEACRASSRLHGVETPKFVSIQKVLLIPNSAKK